jgi:hypothetical protein
MASDAGKPVPRIGVAETFMARNAGNAGTSHRRDRYRRNGDGYHETSRQEHVVGPLSIAASPAVGGQGGTAWAAALPKHWKRPQRTQEYSESEISERVSERWRA